MDLDQGRSCMHSVSTQDGSATARGDQHLLCPLHLIAGSASELANCLQNVVHPMDVGLAEQPTMGVDRDRAQKIDVSLGNEVPAFAWPTEPVGLQLVEDDGAAVLID